MSEAVPETTVAWAYRAAEERKAEAEEAARASAEAAEALARAEHVYDPRPYPEAAPAEPALYEGTGVGFFYGLPGSEWVRAELGDWQIVNLKED